jgi:hypothetical protein
MRTGLLVMFLLATSLRAAAQQPKDTNWDDWRFLLGKWTAEGGGQPGQASTGGFSFDSDLQGKILVRRNYSEYPATGNKAAFRHDDLMVIYQEPQKGTSAVYFDNEGHSIHYSVSLSDDKKTITFVSDVTASTPRFRLIYRRLKDDSLSVEFDMAPPGSPDSFSKYVEGRATRK